MLAHSFLGLSSALIALLALLSTAASFYFGLTSFGNGIIFQIAWQVCSCVDSTLCDGNTSTAALYLTLGSTLLYPAQAWMLRQNVDNVLAKHLIIPLLIGITAAMMSLSQNLPSMWLCRILGGLLLVAVIQKLYADGITPQHVSTDVVYNFKGWKYYLLVWTVGFVSGVLSGLYSVAGPPLVLFFANSGLKKDTSKSMLALLFLVISIYRNTWVILISSGSPVVLSLESAVFLLCLLSLVSVGGMMCGHHLSAGLSQGMYNILQLLALSMGSAILLLYGTGVTVKLIGVGLSALVIALYYYAFQSEEKLLQNWIALATLGLRSVKSITKHNDIESVHESTDPSTLNPILICGPPTI